MENITLRNGAKAQVNVNFFPAWEGYHIQNEYSDFVRSQDQKYKESFVLKVLQYCEIVKEETSIQLITSELVSNQLQSWQNVEQIFKAVLVKNGIDPEQHAQKASYWNQAGKDLALGFISETSKLIGPALDFAATLNEAK